jgi:hypothetical protein
VNYLSRDWPQTAILLMSASQVVRIIGTSHWHLEAFQLVKESQRIKAILRTTQNCKSYNFYISSWQSLVSIYSVLAVC